jgi:hypothetical protein
VLRNDFFIASYSQPILQKSKKNVSLSQMKNSTGIVFLCCLTLASCVAPRRNFESYSIPSPPDYSLDENWAALPNKKDSADVVPKKSDLKDGQANATVDVFFIHPTTHLRGKSWNADVKNTKLNHLTDKTTIFNQASVFNGSCKIYAPRYRQATLYSFLDKSENKNGEKALTLAYADVKAAFQYYLKNLNKGRPFIIASHSQGSRHAFLLIKDCFENNVELRKLLICAYIIGMDTDIRYEHVIPCDSASETGCMIAWRTAKWGTKPNDKFFKSTTFCTNPLSWKIDERYVSKEKNLGGSPFYLKRIDKAVCDAQVKNKILWVHKPNKRGYFPLSKNYHMADYNLFYLNIRENIALRVNSYLEKNKK